MNNNQLIKRSTTNKQEFKNNWFSYVKELRKLNNSFNLNDHESFFKLNECVNQLEELVMKASESL